MKKTSQHTRKPTVTLEIDMVQEALRYLEKMGDALNHKGMQRLVASFDERLERVIA